MTTQFCAYLFVDAKESHKHYRSENYLFLIDAIPLRESRTYSFWHVHLDCSLDENARIGGTDQIVPVCVTPILANGLTTHSADRRDPDVFTFEVPRFPNLAASRQRPVNDVHLLA